MILYIRGCREGLTRAVLITVAMEVAVLAAYIFPAINVVMKRQPVKDFDLKAG